ncbi:MAG: polysaccharide deacetylase family protein [Ruminococcus sp.]|nr:polysaccharide deacetylase family protein [Ruminococcus sp.]
MTTQKNNDTTTVRTTTAPVTTTTEAPKPQTLTEDSFENGSGKWTARGDVTIGSDSESCYSGSKCVKVSGRSKAWNGIACELGSEFKAGNTYSFAAAVLQASGEAEEIRLSLQYKDNTGTVNYAHIASASAADKTWTKLENTSYTIPEGAEELLLYIETADKTCDLYIDDVKTGTEGCKFDITTGGGKVGEIKAPQRAEGVDISWIDPSKPMVAISFDDGTRDATQEKRIIDALNENGFHATFFYVGNWISSPDTVRYVYQSGHEVANHTTTHPYLTQKSASEIRSEFDQTDAKLRSIIGAEPSKLMRLPYLQSNATVEQTLYDVPLISCAIDTGDWNKASKDQIVNTIKTNMNNGSLKNAIVLCHENYSTTASAMEEVLPYLKAQGWQVVTISEMFAVNGKELKGGQIYKRC